jgi:hypothetical protein
MSRRSVMNDRYRVDRAGKTRKSASSAKPKRAAGEATSAPGKKKAKAKPAAKRSSLWGRGPAREPVPKVEPTPVMKKLRRWWWVCMAVAVILAVAMIPTAKLKNRTYDSLLFGVYAAALGGALYIEFGPLRKARMAAIADQKSGGKSKHKGATAKQASEAKSAPEQADAAAPVAGSKSLSGLASRFFGPKKPADDAKSDAEGDTET